MKSPSIRLPRKRMHATWHCQHSLSEKLTNRIVLFEKIRKLGRYKDRSGKKETNKISRNFGVKKLLHNKKYFNFCQTLYILENNLVYNSK